MAEEYESAHLNYVLDMTNLDTEWGPSLLNRKRRCLIQGDYSVTNHQDHGWQSELWPCLIHIINLRPDWSCLVRHLAIVLLLVPSELGVDIIH